MAEHLDTILRLVAEGKLSAADAEPLLAALSGPPAGTPLPPDPPAPSMSARRQLRIEVVEGGRRVVNLRIPLGLAGVAADLVPGLSPGQAATIREAIRAGTVGPILEVQGDDGDRVVIATE